MWWPLALAVAAMVQPALPAAKGIAHTLSAVCGKVVGDALEANGEVCWGMEGATEQRGGRGYRSNRMVGHIVGGPT